MTMIDLMTSLSVSTLKSFSRIWRISYIKLFQGKTRKTFLSKILFGKVVTLPTMMKITSSYQELNRLDFPQLKNRMKSINFCKKIN